MADYSNSAIPRNDDVAIMTNDIRQTLGLPNTTINNRFGRLCISDNVNKWSFRKPIFFKLDGSRLTEPSDRGVVAGFCNVGSFENVAVYDYKKPDTNRRDIPYRLYDFVGYKHKAPKPKVTGSSTTASPNSNLDLTLIYRTCEIPIYNLAGASGSANAVCVFEKIAGGHRVVAFQPLTNDQLTSTTPITFTFNIPYTTANYSQTTTFDLPYYIGFGHTDNLKPNPVGSVDFLVGSPESDEVKGIVKITVVIRGDLNNELQWRKNNVTVGLMNGLAGGGQLTYDAFQVFYESDCINAANNNICYVRIKNLGGSYLSSPSRNIDIQYRVPNTNTWRKLITINAGVNNNNFGNWGYPWLNMASLRVSGLPRAIEEFKIYANDLIL